ncbi:MAG TPA: FAD-dependent monooxygenase [Pyrinomonadaceae bacterium]|nr:FAD-dependent monooxygenase [Pyrinomonadaceae bacterium]
MTTDVLIIGAGPTGLSLACQLLRYGIDFVIVERKEGVTPFSKAIGVHARTLEIYEQLELAEKAIEQGAIADKGRLLVDGEIRGELHFGRFGEGLSRYPFLLMLEQSKNEQLLYEYMQRHGREVEWQTELEDFTRSDSGVSARVKSADGNRRTIEAKYLVGCDGPRSLVRNKLGIDFVGGTFERTFYVADAQIDWQFSHDGVHVCLANESFVGFFPLPGEKRYRIVGVFPEQFSKDEGDVLYEEIETEIKQLSELDLDIHDVEWFSTYKVHTRHAARFSDGRCFLAGDAAHVHTPAGAQGMNTGIQDGYNLAWKLALVLQNVAGESLLSTYNEERLENAKNLLRTTDRMFQMVAGEQWWLAFLRMNVLPSIANSIFSLDWVRKAVFPTLSQIGINYRHSSLSRHAGDEDFAVKAGDRMPYFENVYDRLRAPRFHLLAFGSEMNSDYGSQVDCYSFPLTNHVRHVFGTEQPFNILLRPDNYIGCIATEISSTEVESYIKR